MTANKRPSTSSLRRFISSRPYVAIAELRRRFVPDQPDAMSLLDRHGQVAWVGLPEREATKLQDLWLRDEIGLQLSVEVRAPVVVGLYPMRIAHYVVDGSNLGHSSGRAATRVPSPVNNAHPANGSDLSGRLDPHLHEPSRVRTEESERPGAQVPPPHGSRSSSA